MAMVISAPWSLSTYPEKLPCLVVLELTGYTCQTMYCSAQGFPQMQELKLNFSTKEWRMEEGTMPKLCHLELFMCMEMKKLPKGCCTFHPSVT